MSSADGKKSKPKQKPKQKEPDDYVFRIFACGGKGGAYAGDLTSFFIAHKDQPYNFLSMDAGSGMDCIRKAKENGVFDEYLFNKGDPGFTDPDDNKRPPLNDIGWFKHRQLNGFLVTHAHIDHTAGLVVGSADDAFKAKKPVIAQKAVLDGVEKTFTQPLWPPMFYLEFYERKELVPGAGFSPLNRIAPSKFDSSPIKIQSFWLSHDGSLGKSASTAFLVCDDDETACVLFFGDTGPDNWEFKNMKDPVVRAMADKDMFKLGPAFGPDPDPLLGTNNYEDTKKQLQDKVPKPSVVTEFDKLFKERAAEHGYPAYPVASPKDFHPLHDVWDKVIKLIEDKKLKTIFIETSYLNARPGGMLYGHLTPALLQAELEYINRKLKAPASITVFAMHIKPVFTKGAKLESPHLKMQSELLAVQTHFKDSKLKVKIEIPYQTDMMYVYGAGKATDIHRHGTYLAAKADVQGSQLQAFRSESEDEDEGDADGVYGQGVLGSAGYQAHAYENAYAHHGLYGGQGFGGGGYGPPPAYQVMSYAPGYVVDAPPTSVVGSGSQSADLFPVFLALGTLICCVAVVFGMFVCGWVFHRVSRPRNKVPRFARVAARDEDDIEYGHQI